MDRTRVELVAPLLRAELRSEAERERLAVAAAPAGTRPLDRALAGIGRSLVRAGTRLERRERPATVAPLALAADLCRCGP